jgi:hypothetical protein
MSFIGVYEGLFVSFPGLFRGWLPGKVLFTDFPARVDCAADKNALKNIF